ALYYSRSKTPPPDIPSQDYPQVYEPRIKKKRRSASYSDIDNSSSNSDSNSEYNCDSGYNSDSSSDTKAEYYHQKMAEFKEAGPTILNPSKSILAAIEIEEQNWEL
ncbi:uncharacterized protein K444DRAFT_544806, partial [Hyaloscypha bicolor E]